MRKLRTHRIGYVYVVESLVDGTVKIGCSTRPNSRIKTIQSQANVNGRIWVSPLQPNRFELEGACHKAHASTRQNGEWFAIRFEDAVQSVMSLLSDPPTQHEINSADATVKANCNVLVKGIASKFSPPDFNWLSSLRSAQTIQAFFGLNLITTDSFYPVEKFGGLSMFVMCCAVMVYELTPLELAEVMLDAVSASNGDNPSIFISGVISNRQKLAAKKYAMAE